MILASELRIGNIFRGIAGIQTVFSIEDNTERGKYNMDQYNGYSHLILCKENGNQYKPCEIEPISFSSEWLIRLGFIQGTKMMFLPVPMLDMEIHAVLFHGQYVIELHNHVKAIITEVKYIHQLQNLFQSLTLQELTIK